MNPYDRVEPRAVAIAIALAAGAALACAAMPLVYRVLPSDLSRMRTVTAAMREERPRIVVFGDSRAEGAVDARLLATDALNLATPDQSLGELLVLADALPQSVETVVVIVSAEDLGSDWVISPVIDNALWMHGVRAQAPAREAFARCFGATVHARGDVRQRFDARWPLRQALESALRTRIRPSLHLDRERTDLHFPSIYAVPLPPARFAADVAFIRDNDLGGLHPSKACALADLAARLGAQRRRLVLVIPPIHSGAKARGYERVQRELAAFARANGLTLADETGTMPDAAFADARHLTWAGARAFTPRLRSLMR